MAPAPTWPRDSHSLVLPRHLQKVTSSGNTVQEGCGGWVPERGPRGDGVQWGLRSGASSTEHRGTCVLELQRGWARGRVRRGGRDKWACPPYS